MLKLYNHNIKLIATQDDGSVGEGERVTVRVPTAGRYYLRIANKTGAKSPGSYSVSVTRLDSQGKRPT